MDAAYATKVTVAQPGRRRASASPGSGPYTRSIAVTTAAKLPWWNTRSLSA